MAALYAATHPDATAGLVLFQPHIRADDVTDAEREALREGMSRWGTQQLADQMLAANCPTLLRSESDRVWFANWLRVGAGDRARDRPLHRHRRLDSEGRRVGRPCVA
jgi:pimeloyl-ACP methyl ester carboxylesterase